MWQRWRRLFSSRGGGDNGCTSPRPSFAFKDLRSIADDVSAGDQTRSPAAASAVFHRVRIASAALRAWRLPAIATAEEKKILLYYTSLRIVRKTFEDCRAVRSILKGFRVAIDDRDLSMDSRFLSELKQILGKKQLSLPRVFIGGRYIGGFEEIQQLHESGELKRFVEGVAPAIAGVCEVCGGMRFVLCEVCNGSHKYYSEKSRFRTCNACNENGLVRCPGCCAGA